MHERTRVPPHERIVETCPGAQRGYWRAEVTAASGLNALAGLWLMAAPSVLGYFGGDPRWIDILAGAAVFVLAVLRGVAVPRSAALSFVNLAIGLALVLAGLLAYESARAMWNDLCLGVLVSFLAATSAMATPRRQDLERRQGDQRGPLS
jgi:hypothetical protein